MIETMSDTLFQKKKIWRAMRVERAAGDGAYGRADPISCIVRHFFSEERFRAGRSGPMFYVEFGGRCVERAAGDGAYGRANPT